jgi:hypothetical protein
MGMGEQGLRTTDQRRHETRGSVCRRGRGRGARAGEADARQSKANRRKKIGSGVYGTPRDVIRLFRC